MPYISFVIYILYQSEKSFFFFEKIFIKKELTNVILDFIRCIEEILFERLYDYNERGH